MKKSLLFLGVLVLGTSLFAKNVVLTSIQPTYSIAKELTKNTSIDVKSVFASDVSMDMAREAIAGEDFQLPKEKVDAVIDISRVWTDDNLFERVRQENIRVVEIDASYPFDSKKSTLFFSYDKDGKVIPYVWLGSKNIVRMAAIITKDLIALYPKEKGALEKNFVNFSAKALEIEKAGNEAFLSGESSEVISLSPNIKYFLNDFNIYSEDRNPEEITEETAAKIMKETGIRVFISDRYLKKKVLKAIEEAGGRFVVLNTLNIPMDQEGKMDEAALWKMYQANIDALQKAFQK